MASIDSILDRQHETFRLISRTIVNFKKIGVSNITLAHVETRLTALEANWKKFEESHEKLVQLKVSPKGEILKDSDYFKNDIFGDCEEAFLQAKSEILEFRNNLTALAANNSVFDQSVAGHVTNSSKRLPKISLPKFSGRFTDWSQFRDLFVSMVSSNSDITSVEKLHYLKASVSSEPAQLIKNVAVTGENFTRAWEILVSRYENQRLLTDSHLATLFNVSKVTKESSVELKRLLGDTKEALGALETLGSPIKHWDHILVFMIVRKLDTESLKEWEKGIGGKLVPSSFKELELFIIGRIHTLEALEQASGNSFRSRHQLSYSRSTNASSHAAVTRTQMCILCRENHYIASCPVFKSKSPEQKKEIVIEKKLCYNCLGSHFLKNCRTSKRCQICGRQHHTLLHSDATPDRSQPSVSNSFPSVSTSPLNSPSQTMSHTAQPQVISRSLVLLATAIVRVTHPNNGQALEARALLDPGSESSFITEALCQQLQLPRNHATIPVIGVGAQRSGVTRGLATLNLQSSVNPLFSCVMNALVLPRLTSFLPSSRIFAKEWPHLQGLRLADPDYYRPKPIDLILGADVYGYVILEAIQRGPPGSPIAQNTRLGWVLSGSVSLEETAQPPHVAVQGFQCSLDYELDHLIERFWVQEEISQPPKLSPEDETCEQHFRNTFSRNQNGRYIVRLPLKGGSVIFGDSRSPASRMLSCLEKRFERNINLKKSYCDFLSEYESLGHMRTIADTSRKNDRVYFLPHHGVIRESSSTTKLRVVFNGSQRTNLGCSLNDHLLTGPKLQAELTAILSRWRRHPIVFSADIEKMYRQILLHEEDRDLQRILWRDDSVQPVREYQLCTVTYGLSSAPFLAIRVLHQLVSDESEDLPLAGDIVLRDMYVDDVLSGAENLEQGREKIRQLRELMRRGGFHLQKWTTNVPAVLNDIPSEQKESAKCFHEDQAPHFRTLGILWTPRDDCFAFLSPDITDSTLLTKRKVLSHIARLFDPLGWLAPIVIRAKVFMQELWCQKVDWDEPLPDTLSNHWRNFVEELKHLPKVKIPRWIGLNSSSIASELHGFANASQTAIACVVYLRVLSDSNDVCVSLVSAKTKVAPLKKVTIPRLELCAASLLVKLVRTLVPILEISPLPVHLWTDSTVALAWIRGQPSRWKDFVRNRVTEIQTLANSRWHHVPGTENPADIASRGCSPTELQESELWNRGPHWLSQHSTSWPSSSPTLDLSTDFEERRPVNANHNISGDHQLWELCNRYSKLSRLLRVTSLVRRAAQKFKEIPKPPKIPTSQGAITPLELDASLLFWVAAVQEVHFVEVKLQLKKTRTLPRKQPLLRLAPFLDSNQILRVGGRLEKASLSYDERHPMILPRDSVLSTLIIDHYHRLTLHGGAQLTTATMRQRFWILGGRVPVRSFIYRCVVCARQRAVTSSQQMGQLPVSRVSRSRPFLHSGVDYAGPFSILASRYRGAKSTKGYLVIFVCFSTSAVHLELVSDYTTEAFIAAFKRFTSRRGICVTITSDCGKNLIGADHELRRLLSESSDESFQIAKILAECGTQWKFNPPSAPHFGGKWEAGVKSVKFHLKRVIKNTRLTFEEFATILAQIESTLNSRPLCAISDDASDLSILTPGHFLIGSALNTVPEPNLADVQTSRLSRWQQLRQLLEHFWKRWSVEYLQSIQNMTKWQQFQENLRVGSIVLVKNENYPPSLWPLGRVLKVYRGTDNLVRVALVKTQTSTLKRPIVKLCLLPVATGEQ